MRTRTQARTHARMHTQRIYSSNVKSLKVESKEYCEIIKEVRLPDCHAVRNKTAETKTF